MADDGLERLSRLAQMVLDKDLARVRAAAQVKDASLAALEAIDAPAAPPDGLSPVAAGLAALRYQRWADTRRAEINTRLARQTAEWLEAREKAALAFGRTQALGKLAKQAKLAKRLD